MSECVYCTKLEQWLGSRAVCERRVQVNDLFVDCVGCDLSPLTADKTSKSKMVYNDPPAGAGGRPATLWRSGGKRIGTPRKSGDSDYSQRRLTSKQPIAERRKMALKEPVKKSRISVPDLINEEVKKK